jgi:16S rRNA (uracil1498-N3)-methyltransferase
MRISRVHVDQDLSPGVTLELDERAARYISQVLRLRPGNALTLFNGDGRDLRARVLESGKRHCRVEVQEVLRTEQPAGLLLHLGIGISRGERMDYAIQKAVELGVAAITPLQTERCVVQLKEQRADLRLAHWRGVVTAACEQSGRSLLPTLHPVCPLRDWLVEHNNGILLHHEAKLTLSSLPAPMSPFHLLVGPEGGLDDDERASARKNGFEAVRLGPRIMRTETAPLAALAAIQTLWGDFR